MIAPNFWYVLLYLLTATSALTEAFNIVGVQYR
jgi:hypothetical protein